MVKDKFSNGKLSRSRKNNVIAYLFLSPWIIGFILFSGIPIIASIILGFTKWDIISAPTFIGLKNYFEMFHAGSDFWHVMIVTLQFTLLSVVITMSWALALALILNSKIKAKGIFQFFFFVPAVMPGVALAFIFQLLYNQEIGLFNFILGVLGINGPNWLMDNHFIIPAIVFVFLYSYTTGQMMLVFNASLKEVPKEFYEASKIDGANSIQQFFYVTIAYISPVILFNLVVATISALNSSFSIIYPLTDGGPAMASEVISLNIYHEGFKSFRMGYASSLATVLFLMVASISWLQFHLSKKYVYYES